MKMYDERLPLDGFEEFEIREAGKLLVLWMFSAFLIDKEFVKYFHKLISNIIWTFKIDAKKIYPAFCLCVLNTKNLFLQSFKHTCFFAAVTLN